MNDILKTVIPLAIVLLIIGGILAIIFKPSRKKEPIINQSTPIMRFPSIVKQNPLMNKKQYTSAPGVLPSEKINNKKVVIETEKGNIVFELFPKEAPKTVSNFIFLSEEGFYDGIVFHRVEPGFVIQGGDPKGDGTGGPGYRFEDEPVKRTYDKGIVAMANAGPNTNGSQFFIMLADNPQLPPNYTIFGKVISGQEIVDSIKVGDVMSKVIIVNK